MECTQPTISYDAPDGLLNIAALTPAAAAVRAALLDGLTTVEAFAEGVGKCKRTVDEWIARGMPTVYVGRTPYIPINQARDWLLKPGSRCAPPRKVGRPKATSRTAQKIAV